MTSFELDYRKYERKQQIHQLYNTFKFTTEEVFEKLEISYVEMETTRSSKTIEPISNRNFLNTFNNNNDLNQRQHVHKHKVQPYKSRTFKIPRSFSHPYLKETYFGYGLGNK